MDAADGAQRDRRVISVPKIHPIPEMSWGFLEQRRLRIARSRHQVLLRCFGRRLRLVVPLLRLSPVGDLASAVENASAAYFGITVAPHEYF
jgi:hypothetical protein